VSEGGEAGAEGEGGAGGGGGEEVAGSDVGPSDGGIHQVTKVLVTGPAEESKMADFGNHHAIAWGLNSNF
jgi:hypothetical protein